MLLRGSLCKDMFYYSYEMKCEPCEGTDVHIMALKVALLWVVQIGFVFYMYKRWNRVNPAGLITIGLLVNFVQTIQTLSRLPLLWPSALLVLFEILDYLSLWGLEFLLQFKFECITGHGIWPRVWRSAIAPLSIFFDFAVLAVIHKAFRRSLNKNFVINIIGLTYLRLFITITSMAMELFFVDPMPNGKQMVKAHPDVEFGGPTWKKVLPVQILSCIIHSGMTFAVIVWAVYKAPVAASTDPGFAVRFRFAFGALRTDRWWWVLVHLTFGFSMNLVQAITQNVHFQLYMSIVLLLCITFAQFLFRPFKFDENNAVDLMLKFTLLLFIMLATSYIDSTLMRDGYLAEMNEAFGYITVAFFILGTLFALYMFVRWVFYYFRPAGLNTGEAASAVWRFRDIMAAQCLMSEKDVLKRVLQMTDADVHRLEAGSYLI